VSADRSQNAEWTVAAADAGVRLDKFLASADRLGSRGRAASALERGKISLNGVESSLQDAAYRLAAGDAVRFWQDRPGSSKKRVELVGPRDLRIIFEDDALIVLDKPAGLLSVPLPRRDAALSVFHVLEDYLRLQGRRQPFVVHRIDRDTSGLVVFAKHPVAQELLKGQFRRHEAERVYRAVVYGHPTPPEGQWHDYLVWDQTALIQKKTHPNDPRGKAAISQYRVIEAFRDTSLIEVRLHTGKRNQIRIQARLRGHTLVGETRYVFGPDELRAIDFPRQALHAWRLALQHPHDGRPLAFEAPVPADLLDLLTKLR
jgi:23S rRNA pseudouridine1911/1915/1917 synthase